MCQSIPFKSIGLPIESVSVIRISEIMVFETGEKSARRGSNVNG